MSNPFEPYKNPDGKTYNGLKMLAAITGLSEDEVRESWERVKAQQKVKDDE